MIVERDAPWRFWFSDESSLLTPLIWNVAPRDPVPLKLIDEPDDAVGLFWPEVGFSWKPGKMLARFRKLPGFSAGLSMICCSVSTPFTSAFVELMRGASPVTVTVSATPAGFCSKFSTRVSFSDTCTPSRTTVWNPSSFAVTVYRPMGNRARRRSRRRW